MCKFFRLLSAQVKIHQIFVILETTNQFFFKFCITLQGHETQLLHTFLVEILYTFNKRSLSKYKLGKILFEQPKVVNFVLWWTPFVKIMHSFSSESTEELSLMTLESAAKFKQKLTFQTWHKKFGAFSPNHSKVWTFHFNGLFLSKV